MKPFQNYLLLTILFTITNFTYSQIDLGLIGGIYSTTNSIDPSEDFETNSRVEYGIGILVNIPISSAFSIQAQPIYLRKGTDIEVIGFQEEVSVLGTYFEVPVFARYNFGSKNIVPYIIAGPSIGFLLSAKQTASFIPPEAEDIKEDIKSIDFSLSIGAGVRIPIGKPAILIQASYMLGITNIDDDSSIDDFTESIKSRGIALMAGISLPIEK